jgi:hypothetical protein
VAKAKFGLSTPKGVQGEEEEDPPHSLSRSLLLMLGSGALSAHEENVN